MTLPFITSQGQPLRLGAELGRGGEGAVYEHSTRTEVVIKLYHNDHLPDAQKQLKLQAMTAQSNPLLLDYAAWPLDTVHHAQSHEVVGIIMPKIQGFIPLHQCYSPAERRQQYPQWGWDFLVQVARNTAAAFATLHVQGHVIGDVNQGNILVGANSKVRLIDCDSFQIQVQGTWNLCPVGVAHFTPPELQTISAFDQQPRTANHDNFGLAVLIFHLLFGGRHPFAGRPLRDEVGQALETDISHFRYVYARDAAQRGFAPPLGAIPLAIVPNSTQMLLEQAFTESGVIARPSAAQWVEELDRLLTQVVTCHKEPTHRYLKHNSSCLWCVLEQQGLYFFGNKTATPPKVPESEEGTYLGELVIPNNTPQYWAVLANLQWPSFNQNYTGAITPQPFELIKKKNIYKGGYKSVLSLLAWLLGAGLAVFFAVTLIFIPLAILLGIWLFIVLQRDPLPLEEVENQWITEFNKRNQFLLEAQQTIKNLEERFNQEVLSTRQAFEQKASEVASAIKAYEQLMLNVHMNMVAQLAQLPVHNYSTFIKNQSVQFQVLDQQIQQNLAVLNTLKQRGEAWIHQHHVEWNQALRALRQAEADLQVVQGQRPF